MAEKAISILEPKTQVCRSCGRDLPLSEYRPSRLGMLRTCKECVRNHQIQARLDRKLAKMQGDELEKAKTARLSEFQPRELMAELKRRGYEFTMEFTETHIIHSKDIKI